MEKANQRISTMSNRTNCSQVVTCSCNVYSLVEEVQSASVKFGLVRVVSVQLNVCAKLLYRVVRCVLFRD